MESLGILKAAKSTNPEIDGIQLKHYLKCQYQNWYLLSVKEM